MSEKNKNDWEDLAELDPLWAILTVDKYKFNQWNLDEFFTTGEKIIEEDLTIGQQFSLPVKHATALDFGCGVGRLTRAISKRFDMVYGIDISESMITKAQELNKDLINCKFINSQTLSIFPDNNFDLVYTNIVLQHIPKYNIKPYLEELLRILSNDGLFIFQLPSYIPLKYRLQPTRKIYSILRKIGIDKQFLYYKLNLVPMEMNFIPESEITKFIDEKNAKILKIRSDTREHNMVENKIYFVTKK